MAKPIKWLPWLLLLSWMALIFWSSAQPGPKSSEMSGTIVGMLPGEIAPQSGLWRMVETVLRKSLHMGAFAILAILARWCCENWKNRWFWSFGICVLYAICDELHQYFVPERSAQWTDCLIDSAGVCLGLAVFFVAARLARRKKRIQARQT